MNDKTVTLTVAEFRKNIKAALDYALEGGVVIVDRMGQKFMLNNIPRDMNLSIGYDPASGKDKGVEVITRFEKGVNTVISIDGKAPQKNIAGATPQPLAPVADPLPACCSKANPCKHWEFNELTQEWVNSINGERKGVI